MALIVCPECGGQVSDRANACPHCGFPIIEGVQEKDVKNDDFNITGLFLTSIPSKYLEGQTVLRYLTFRHGFPIKYTKKITADNLPILIETEIDSQTAIQMQSDIQKLGGKTECFQITKNNEYWAKYKEYCKLQITHEEFTYHNSNDRYAMSFEEFADWKRTIDNKIGKSQQGKENEAKAKAHNAELRERFNAKQQSSIANKTSSPVCPNCGSHRIAPISTAKKNRVYCVIWYCI